MTREEQIYSAAINDCDLYGEDNHFQFTRGAKWADEHPKEGMVSIDKVCEWIEKYVNFAVIKQDDGIFNWIELAGEELSEDFRKAMEE